MAGNFLSAKLCALLCIVLTSSILISDVNARGHFSASPSTGHKLSGTNSRSSTYGGGGVVQQTYSQFFAPSYPPSGHSLSGNSGRSSGVNSGSTAHGYPSSPQNSLSGGASSSRRDYSSSNVQSNFGSSRGSAQYPSAAIGSISGSAVQNYPKAPPNSLSGGASGSGSRPASYPPSNGYSGNRLTGFQAGSSSYPHSPGWGTNTQKIYQVNTGGPPIVYHHHYVYSPPTVIHYGSHGSRPVSYPVYTGVPPPYVFEYRSSKNKYGYLLAGLALYNLGRMSGNSELKHYHNNYIPRADEYCKFGVQYRTGNFEEMAIDCRTITYFTYEDWRQNPMNINQNQNYFANGISAIGIQQQGLASNGQLLPNTQQVNGVTTTTTQVYVNDPRFYGRPVDLRPDMECYVIRNTRYANMRKTVPCELLRKYSDSLRNSGVMIRSSLIVILIVYVLLY